MNALEIELPEPPEAESPEDPLEDQWMYDSARDFPWQTEVFRRAQKRDQETATERSKGRGTSVGSGPFS